MARSPTNPRARTAVWEDERASERESVLEHKLNQLQIKKKLSDRLYKRQHTTFKVGM